ncbi:hypothetical protein ABFX02_10G167700 [Erythranthe guttata]
MASNKGTRMSENDNKKQCSTPKGERFKILETLICPPAPKKRRLTSTSSCSFKRPRIEFFTSPELELFFLCAFRTNA